MGAILSLVVALRLLAEVVGNGIERERNAARENRRQSDANGREGVAAPRTADEEEEQLQQAISLSLATVENVTESQTEEAPTRPQEGNKPDTLTATEPPSEARTTPRCPVCFAQDRQALDLGIVTTRCGHIFCRPCADKLSKVGKSPVCRNHIRREDMVRLYLPA